MPLTYLITNWYSSKDDLRNKELIKAFNQNLNNPKIDCIVAVYEPDLDPAPPTNPKVIPVKCDARPKFSTYFALAKMVIPDGSICIIANSDIWFPEQSIEKIDDRVSLDVCLALAKYNNRHGILDLVNQVDSQDSWCFRTPIKTLDYADFSFGCNGCDNRLAYELDDAGYTVLNPAKAVVSVHEHQSNMRTIAADRSQLVPKPYLMCPVTE